MGDVLWIEPVISALTPHYDTIIVHTKFNKLFENYPLPQVLFKDKLSFFEKLLLRFEKLFGLNFLSVNLDGAYEESPCLHFLNAYQKKAKLPFTKEYPKLFLSDSEAKQRTIKGKYIVLHLESLSDKKYRQIYGIDWPKLVVYLKEKGYEVVQLGIQTPPLPGTTQLKTSIRELISLISHADFFVGIDSGPSHIAASLKIPSLLIFGAIEPKLRHFPDIFNGILFKQPCAEQCTIFDVKKESQHHCVRLDEKGIPQCCTFTTMQVILKMDELFEKCLKNI